MPRLRFDDRAIEPRAILFDKDGVLLDFPFFWHRMIEQRIQRVADAFPLSAEDRTLLLEALGITNGKVEPHGPLVMASKSESVTITASFLYQRGLPWVKAREIGQQSVVQAEGDLKLEDLVKPTPRLVEAFRSLSEAGFLLGIATTDDKKNTEELLDFLGLSPLIGSVVGSDRVARGKPHPDMIELAGLELGVHPSEAVMVGDGVNDLIMGRNAGTLGTLGVLTGVTTHAELAPHADWILPAAGDLLDHLDHLG
ncbi:MAG: HAD family hydrolase [Bacteroidota bacterium]